MPCPAGKYCAHCSQAEMKASKSGCENGILVADCPAGYYCPEGTRSATQFPCPAGTYGPAKGAKTVLSDDCKDCPVDKYCPLGSSIP